MVWLKPNSEARGCDPLFYWMQIPAVTPQHILLRISLMAECLAHNQGDMGSIPVSATSSGDTCTKGARNTCNVPVKSSILFVSTRLAEFI